jgi:putative hydrolase of HD superfamily
MKYLSFLSEIGKLKDIERTGWKIYKVKNPESVADHSHRTAIMAMLYSKSLGLDEDKCVKMAIVHDLEEVYTGDIATRADEKNQTVNNVKKEKIEENAFNRLMKLLDDKKEITELWQEYHECKTPEAKWVNDLDKIEMVLQALDYKKGKRTKEDLEEFFQTSGPRIKTKKGKELWNKIRKGYLEL